MNNEYMTINGKEVKIEGEKNLLEVIRKSGVDMPTFCYHSELSVYGACRLCIADIDGMGIQTSCSTAPKAGMKIRTNTNELRNMRKTFLQLMLADHHQNCFTCNKSSGCKLQDLSHRLGVREVPFKASREPMPIDESSPSLVRDPNKCILCGDCVRACSEIQNIGAIDFAHRGSDSMVLPAFGKDLDKVECVYCGLCASVCPTGAITPKSEINKVWDAINDESKKVVVQIAPAIRVAIGDMFGLDAGEVTTGKIVSALRMLGVDSVYDTSFAADMTIFEEATEFIARKTTEGSKLPLFTSCCPGWVQYAEQYFPEILPHLSSCKSPQQMFGSVAKETLPQTFDVEPKDLYVVSVMPCTAKKFEAQRPEFSKDGVMDIDAVLTTKELGRMIKEAGIEFNELDPESLDMPLGFKTGAGVIFGNTGGVSEAVLRYASEKITGETLKDVNFAEVRGLDGIKEANINIGGIDLSLAVVHTLSNAKVIAEQVKAGDCKYDIVEVMACPGGCISGAGQPQSWDSSVTKKRAKAIYDIDKKLQLHKPQENHYVTQCYKDTLGEVGGHKAHELLHTEYQNRKRILTQDIALTDSAHQKIKVSVCVGTSCYQRGAQKLMHGLIDYVKGNDLDDSVNVVATFCYENCSDGPTIKIGQNVINNCTMEIAQQAISDQLKILA